MKAKAIWSSVAEMDLEEIAYFIAVVDHRPKVAEQIIVEIRDACQR